MSHHRKISKTYNPGNVVRRRHSKKHYNIIIYCGLEIYSTACSRNIIDLFFHIGLYILHGLVLKITKYIHKNIRESYENKKFFYPKILLLYLKIRDMNPKSNFVQLHYYRPSSFISKGEYFKEGTIKFQENTIHSIEAQCFYDTGNCPYP